MHETFASLAYLIELRYRGGGVVGVLEPFRLKFYSYDYTHCYFDNEDLEDFLSLLNRLAEYLQVLDELLDRVTVPSSGLNISSER